MMRPGINANRPAMISAPPNSPIMVRLCRAARGNHADNEHDQREDRQQVDRAPRPDPARAPVRSSWIPNDEPATTVISATQIQPSVRCGSVPFGASNCTSPSANAAIAAAA